MATAALKNVRSSSLWRVTLLQLAVVLVFGLFVWRLWRLQVVAGARYDEMARRNRTRLITTDAQRGVIYDRTNQLLMRNVPRFNVMLIPAYLPPDGPDREAILARLHTLLDLPLGSTLAAPAFPPYQGDVQWGLRDLVRQGRLYAPFEPILLKKNVSLETVFEIQEAHLELPGVLVETEAVREYLTGSLTAHLLGYMGPIPAGGESRYGTAQGYDPGDWIGLSGLEYSYEQELRGTKGQKTIEVDVAGREVRTVGQPADPQAGNSLVLTLDLDLQQYVEQVLQHAMKQAKAPLGAAVVSNVNTGEVLAMVSLPVFDNNLFAHGISSREFNQLNTHPAHPLVNHAIASVFPPGSTFKLVPASAGLQEEVITRWTLLTCPSDSGVLLLPNKYYPDNWALAQPFYCWTHKGGYGHGRLDIISALAYSCDIFFYRVSGGYLKEMEGLGLDRLIRYTEMFGYGQASGVDLPGEATGLVPTVKWKRINYSENWTTGDTYNMGIGQGYVLASPLQVHNATTIVANGGTFYQPQLVHHILDAEGNTVRPFQPQVVRQVEVSADNLRLVREGMRAAAQRGTAMWISSYLAGPLKVAAKTGTAEFYDANYPADKDGNLPTHAWFTAFAPYDQPEIAVTVFVYNGGEGANTAMPVAAKILNYYFQLE